MQFLLANGVVVPPRTPSLAASAPPIPTGNRFGNLPILPIICICYTNHALDQFLEGLVDRAGVPITNIVRIGSRSKTERFNGQRLRDLAIKVRGNRKRIWELRQELAARNETLDVRSLPW